MIRSSQSSLKSSVGGNAAVPASHASSIALMRSTIISLTLAPTGSIRERPCHRRADTTGPRNDPYFPPASGPVSVLSLILPERSCRDELHDCLVSLFARCTRCAGSLIPWPSFQGTRRDAQPQDRCLQ